MNTKHEGLTAGERRYLEHVRRARAKGLALSDYARSIGMNPYALYSMRRQMRRKGVLAPATAGSAAAGKEEPASARRGREFVAVRVAQPHQSMVPVGSGMLCRLTHPSGWVIECGSWPPAQWLAECLAGGEHAAR